MDSLKRFFVTPFITALVAGTIHSGIMLSNVGINSAWLGSFIACVFGAMYFTRIMTQTVVRTSDHTPAIWGAGLVGTTIVLALPNQSIMPLVYSLGVAVIGGLIYDFWYSRLGPRSESAVKVGETLPPFTVQHIDGNVLQSADIQKSPALLMFYRGNWCPLCMAQIKEVAAAYQELAKRGVTTYLISNQAHQNSRKLAAKFDVDFQFVTDVESNAAKALGIQHIGGTPLGIPGYEADTTMPTVVLTDASGKVIFADLTDNYRVRPEPSTFLKVLDENGLVSA